MDQCSQIQQGLIDETRKNKVSTKKKIHVEFLTAPLQVFETLFSTCSVTRETTPKNKDLGGVHDERCLSPSPDVLLDLPIYELDGHSHEVDGLWGLGNDGT